MIGNTVLKAQNEMVTIDDMYVDIKAYNKIKNHAKMEMLRTQRHEMRKLQMIRDAYTEEKKLIRSIMIRQKKIGILMLLVSLLLLAVSREGFCVAGVVLGLYTIWTDKIIIHDYRLNNEN